MRSLLFCLCYFFIAQALTAQPLRPELQKLVDSLVEVNEIQSKYVSADGHTPEQYYRFMRLRKDASTVELLSFLNHRSPVVKGYAGWALIDNKYPDAGKLLQPFLRSKEKVTMFSGCFVSSEPLASVIYLRMLNPRDESYFSYSDSLFFASQLKTADSLILYLAPSSPLVNLALSHNNAEPANYDLVRKYARRKNEQAIIELAKYQKHQDIRFLQKLGPRAFKAISFFPHESFWPLLQRYAAQEGSAELYLALAAFKNEASAAILSRIFYQLDSTKKSDRIKELFRSLNYHFCSHYTPLLITIWDQYKYITLKVAKKLVENDPRVAAKGFAKGLLNNRAYQFLSGYMLDVSGYILDADDLSPTGSILPLMLRTIAEYERDNLLDIYAVNIPNCNIIDLKTFLDFARVNKITGLDSILLNKLTLSTYDSEILFLTETILDISQPATKQEAITILRPKRNVWQTGSHSEDFQKLFETYHIRP